MHLSTSAGGNSRANGFTLVEVLVALLVMSIGLLGVGKLVMVSSRSNDSAYLRSQAVAQAYGILDAMRANRQAALSGSYTVSTGAYADPGVNCATTGAGCSGSTLAQYDLYQWKSRLKVAVGPSGDGKITLASVTDATTGLVDVTLSITVQWDDTVAQQSFGATSTVGSVVLESVL